MSGGFIYVVQSSNGLLKIGYTNDPRRRLTMLRTSTADTLTLLGVVPGTPAVEREIHDLLSPWRVRREWFLPCRAMQPLLDALRPVARRRGLGRNTVAHSVIEAFGGAKTVAEISGRTVSQVYRWTYPKERGGTGGFIPQADAAKLLAHAKANGLPVTAASFFGDAV